MNPVRSRGREAGQIAMKNIIFTKIKSSFVTSDRDLLLNGMKKTIFTSFIFVLLFGVSAQAQTGADLTASATKDTKEPVVVKEITPKTKVEPLAIRRQKIEADLRATILKLKLVIDRTQVVIDLLTKNEKDTSEALLFLDQAKVSLGEATDALDQFAGVVIPEVKIDAKAVSTISAKEAPAPATLKDPLKKAEEALKNSKTSLIASINALKESITPKEASQ